MVFYTYKHLDLKNRKFDGNWFMQWWSSAGGVIDGTSDVVLERDRTHGTDRLVPKDLRNNIPSFYEYIYPSVALSLCTRIPF